MHPFNEILRTRLSDSFRKEVESFHLKDALLNGIPQGSIVVSTIELERPLLARMTNSESQAVQMLTEKASILLWITSGRLFKAQSPELAMVLGLARSMMVERPSLKMPVLDLDNGITDAPTSSDHIVSVIQHVMQNTKPDLEYRVYDGALYVSRIIPDASFNKRFRQAQDSEVIQTPISDSVNCKLAVEHVGQIDCLHFKSREQEAQIRPGYLEVQVKVVGINSKVRFT